MDEENNLNNLIPNFDRENVKINLQEFFKNPRFIGELYKNLSLSDTDTLNYLERLSHYCTVKKLYESMPNIDEFATSSKTLKSCFKGDIDNMYFLYIALLPSMFSSFKELYMGKTSRENCLNRLNDEDLQKLDDITVTPNDLSKKQIISEIRSALNHIHYVPGKEELYIKNPKNQDPKIHARDFEANVPYSFLIHFIRLTQTHFRREDHYEFKIDNQELVEDLRENEKNIKYEDVKDEIHIFQGINKYKFGDGVGEDLTNEIVKKEVFRSEQVGNLMSKYFSSHKLDKNNLCYVAESLARPLEIHMWGIFSAIIDNELRGSNKYKGMNSTELINDVYEKMLESYYGFYDGFNSIEGKDVIVDLCKNLGKKRQSNGQSMLKHLRGCAAYADNYLRKRGFLPDKEGDIIYYRKGDMKIELSAIYAGIDEMRNHYYVVSNAVKLFPNRLRLQLIKLVYVNEQVSLQDENVEGLISKVDTSIDENGIGKKPTRERIRDALSHHTYTLLQGVDDIVLRDGYDKKTDSWAREATFSLSKLFESTFRDIDENSIASSYSFLLEFLKNLDN